jgi:hypothetical protein
LRSIQQVAFRRPAEIQTVDPRRDGREAVNSASAARDSSPEITFFADPALPGRFGLPERI